MTIPTRWHKPSCDSPQVVVDGKVPECRACGSSALALLEKAAEEPAPSYSGIKLPPEAPIGQMDLWWPPCVPYTRNGATSAKPRGSSGNTSSLVLQASDSSLSEIYTSTLGRDHLRLLYISGARGIDHPIHGNLVEFERENCPEYETVSYTWGGEDGDSTPRRPAYFGDFWDVLFLTRNCWSLLQYLRPHMGTRVVWVDAICINQNNNRERGAQVSIMTHIYRNCLRVVIYPGDHLVRRDEHRFRERIRHDDIIERDGLYYVDSSGLDIWDSVSKSRYINRVWIIQELILSPMATLALKNHDLYIDNGLLHRLAGKDDGREWLDFFGQSYRLCETTFYEALRMTFYSQATDPRDKIFGILGVLGPNPRYSEIVPEYSLAMRDCVIGTIGFILLVSKEFWPLLNSQTSNTTSQYPSWLPSLDHIASWRDEISLDSVVHRRLFYDRPFREVPGPWRTLIRPIGYKGYDRNAYYDRPVPRVENDFEEEIEVDDFMERNILMVEPEMSWHQYGSIDSSTGALKLRLVRLFDTPHELVEGPHLDKIEEWLSPANYELDLGNMYYHVKGPSAAVCFVTTGKPLGLERPCHLFLAFHVKPSRLRKDVNQYTTTTFMGSEAFLLFAEEAEVSGTFKLLGCCRLDILMIYSASRLMPRSSKVIHRSWPGRFNGLSLFDILSKILTYEPRRHFSRDRMHRCEASLFDLILPGQGATISGLPQLGLAVARIGDPVGVTEEFRRAYRACLHSRSGEFDPVLDDQYVWFTLVDDDTMRNFGNCLLQHLSVEFPNSPSEWRPWNEIFPPWFDLQIPEIVKTEFTRTECPWAKRDVESQVDGQSYELCGQHGRYYRQRDLRSWLPCSQEPKEFKLQTPVRAKMPLQSIMEAIRQTNIHWFLRYLLAFGEKMSKDAEHLLAMGPQPEDSNIYLYDWPKSLVDELGFVWRNELVTFV